jgi:hypothetical protein
MHGHVRCGVGPMRRPGASSRGSAPRSRFRAPAPAGYGLARAIATSHLWLLQSVQHTPPECAARRRKRFCTPASPLRPVRSCLPPQSCRRQQAAAGLPGPVEPETSCCCNILAAALHSQVLCGVGPCAWCLSQCVCAGGCMSVKTSRRPPHARHFRNASAKHQQAGPQRPRFTRTSLDSAPGRTAKAPLREGTAAGPCLNGSTRGGLLAPVQPGPTWLRPTLAALSAQ